MTQKQINQFVPDQKGCLRCGKCCHYINKLGVKTACQYLIKLPTGTTLCRVYKTRLGRRVGIGENGKPVYCAPRELHDNEPGCPLNSKD